MLSVGEAREKLAIVVPVYFEPSVGKEMIWPILRSVFMDSELYCKPERLLAVVDRDTRAEELLLNPPDGLLPDLRVHQLQKNRAKAGAVWEGLQVLLESTRADYFVTRDCDGDHILEDIPRMVSLAEDVKEQTGRENVTVMGVRPSLEKPMSWVRQEWEVLTNLILMEMVGFLLAGQGRLVDKRFLNGYALDIQSGYRLYSRVAAVDTVNSLSSLPEERTIQMLACETLPFVELLLRGGVFAQVQRLTLVEQPVSSLARLDFGENYGKLLSYLSAKYRIPGEVVIQAVDNHLVDSPLYFSEHREALVAFRERVADNPPELNHPSFL